MAVLPSMCLKPRRSGTQRTRESLQAVKAHTLVQGLSACSCVLQLCQQLPVLLQCAVGDGKAFLFTARAQVRKAHAECQRIGLQLPVLHGAEQPGVLLRDAQGSLWLVGTLQCQHILADDVAALTGLGHGPVYILQAGKHPVLAQLGIGHDQQCIYIAWLLQQQMLGHGHGLRCSVAVCQHIDFAPGVGRFFGMLSLALAVQLQSCVPVSGITQSLCLL